jgi:hypothetical protein
MGQVSGRSFPAIQHAFCSYKLRSARSQHLLSSSSRRRGYWSKLNSVPGVVNASQSLRDAWFDRLETLGMDPLGQLSSEFSDERWHDDLENNEKISRNGNRRSVSRKLTFPRTGLRDNYREDLRPKKQQVLSIH